MANDAPDGFSMTSPSTAGAGPDWAGVLWAICTTLIVFSPWLLHEFGVL